MGVSLRSKVVIPGSVVVALVLAACGSGGSGKTASSRATSSHSGSSVAGAGPIRIYRSTLSGAAERPRGAPRGTGAAIIAFHDRSALCWRFAHLHGFTDATVARIHLGRTGRSGNVVLPLSSGPRMHHQGCLKISPTVSEAIQRNPSDYYVNISSKQYPAGAVRAQL